jgi:hypothetical protein
MISTVMLKLVETRHDAFFTKQTLPYGEIAKHVFLGRIELFILYTSSIITCSLVQDSWYDLFI